MTTTATTTPTSTTSTSATTAQTAGVLGGQQLAGNFDTFLQLLTTQLQNQDPLDPLDTNQFTAQLVQFAGVEQQLKSNDQLKSLVALEQSAQATQADTVVSGPGRRLILRPLRHDPLRIARQ